MWLLLFFASEAECCLRMYKQANRLDAVSPFLTDVLHEVVLGTTPFLSCMNGGILPPGSVKGKG